MVRFKFVNDAFQLDWANGFNNLRVPFNGVAFPTVRIDPDANVVFPGNALDVVNLNGGAVTGFPNGLPTVIKVTKAGFHLWHRTIGGAEGGYSGGLGVGPEGEVFAVGTTDSPSLDIGTDTISAGQDYSYIVKFGK